VNTPLPAQLQTAKNQFVESVNLLSLLSPSLP
jgi:hypothetical protein